MSSESQPGLGRRLGRSIYWILRTTLITLILIVVLVGLPLLAFLAFQETQRSFDSALVRVEANSREIGELATQLSEVEVVQSTRQAQLAGVERGLAALDRSQTAVTDELGQAVARQGELLDSLSGQLASTSSSGESALGNIASLSEAVTALQTDLNRNNGELDALGGDVDRLDGAVEALQGQTAVLDGSVAEIEAVLAEDEQMRALQEVLALFRVWELITRARLRLAEDNVGLASGDVETAVRTMDLLVASSDATVADSYKTVQGRLALAFANLPDDPETAGADLETAWDELDKVLAARILPPQLQVVTPTPAAEPTATPPP